LVADQGYGQAAGHLAQREAYPLDHDPWAMVAAHRVNPNPRDRCHFDCVLWALLGGRLDDLFAVVIAALRADPVRLLGAAAVAAGMGARRTELPGSGPLLAARAGVSGLGYRHEFPSSLFARSGSRPSESGAFVWPLIQIGAAAGTESPTLFAAMRRH